MFELLPKFFTVSCGSLLALASAVLVFMTGCAAVGSTASTPRLRGCGRTQSGTASWHCPARSSREARTASSRPWVNSEFIAAHRTLPMGSKVRVVNVKNGLETVVQITDRGPYAHGRIIDLSQAAARQLDIIDAGTGSVRLEVLTAGEAGVGVVGAHL